MKNIKFAVFTDLHYEHIPDGMQRLKSFVSNIKQSDVDFIVELGDFCSPIEDNRVLLNILNSTGKPHYHMLGNHETDKYTKEEALSFLGMKSSFYSFIYGTVKFIVLDGCFSLREGKYEPYFKRNYTETNCVYPVIPDYELKWLENQLSDDSHYIVIFSHHSLENDFAQRGIANKDAVQELINNANTSTKKVLLCINGHDHGNSLKKIEKTYYFGLNAMSYLWFGPQFEHFCYPDEVHKKYPFLKDIVLYREGLYAVVTITDEGSIEVQGMEGHYQTISPKELGIEGTWNGCEISPIVSSFKIDD